MSGPLHTDKLAGSLDMWLRERIFNPALAAIPLAGGGYEVVDDDELPGMDQFDVVLRAPDGTLYDVEIEVIVSRRPAAPTEVP